MTASAEELLAFHQRFEPLFARREQRAWSLLYLCGRLSDLERKTVESIVLALLGSQPNAVRTAQHFIGHGEWDVTPFLDQAQGLVADWLGDRDGVVIVDGSGVPKQGGHSAGVGWQYCGHLGKLANSQQGGVVVYASRHGHAFLDARLYVPQSWFTAEYHDRWQACRMPETLTFQTEPALGLAMITAVVQRGRVPFQWVTADEKYGENPAFLDGIAALGKWYLSEVAADTRVWWRTPPVEPPGRGLLGPPRLHARVKRTAPAAVAMRDLAARLPRGAWQRRIITEGGKGPIAAEFAAVRVTPIRDQLPGPRGWAIFRRSLGPHPEVKFYLSALSPAPKPCRLSFASQANADATRPASFQTAKTQSFVVRTDLS